MSTIEVLAVTFVIMAGSALLASGVVYDEISLFIERGFKGYVQDKAESINSFFKENRREAMSSLIEMIIPIVVGVAGGALLILGVIYEDVLIAFEDGLKEHIKRKVKRWRHKIKRIFSAMYSIIAEK